MKKRYIIPAIAIPHQMPAEIWWERPQDDSFSDGHDLHALLESREDAERWVKSKSHQASRVAALIDLAWPKEEE